MFQRVIQGLVSRDIEKKEKKEKTQTDDSSASALLKWRDDSR